MLKTGLLALSLGMLGAGGAATQSAFDIQTTAYSVPDLGPEDGLLAPAETAPRIKHVAVLD